MKNVSDEQLMQQVLNKHRPALEELYDRYVRLVYSFALKATHEEQAAREIVQLVYTRLWTTQKSYDPQKGRFINWLLTMTRHLSIDYLRKERKHAAAVLMDQTQWEQMTDPLDNPETAVSRTLLKEEIEAAYQYLSPSQIVLIEQVYWNGYSLSELATLTSEPIGTVKSRLHQTLKILRKHLYPIRKEG